MAQSLEARGLVSSLEHLANRPGVVATLILSRNDGSVIRATGILLNQPLKSNGQALDSETTPSNGQAEATDVEPATINGSGKVGASEPTPLEVFAASVMAFVSSATAMSDALLPSLLADNNHDGPYRPLTGNGDRQNMQAEGEDGQQVIHEASDVQLLRMRTKKHEVVIFPDNKFLSCVVQEVGKHIHNTEGASRV